MNPSSIVYYWHAIELLQPQSVPKLNTRDEDDIYSPFFHDLLTQGEPLPWQAGSPVQKQKLPEKRVWSHSVFAHLYDSLAVTQALGAHFGANQGYTEPQSRETALFALKFTEEGALVADSLILSSEAWFLGCVLAGRTWTHGFDSAQEGARHMASSLLSGTVTHKALHELTCAVREQLGLEEFFGDAPCRHRLRSTPIDPEKPAPADDPLNSFLLDDLVKVAAALERGESSSALAQYLREHDPQQRLYLDHPDASLPIVERLYPHKLAPGCWPSRHHLGLVHSQQLAVNSLLDELGDSAGVLGVNGPPGTGKTTLLRDLIAAVVTRRADVLASFDRASQAFVSNGSEDINDTGRKQTGYRLNPALFGFEIVVASSNNVAVENITLELPQLKTVDASWLGEIDYFADLATLLIDQQAWGLISAALGSKTKRKQFVSRFFYGEPPPKKKPARADIAANDLQSADVLAEQEDSYTADIDLSDKPTGPKGFIGWLTNPANNVPEQERQSCWKAATNRYNASKAAAQALCEQVNAINQHIDGVHQRRSALARQRVEHANHKLALERLQLDLVDHETTQLIPAREHLQNALQTLDGHASQQPGLWPNLITLWGATRRWRARLTRLRQQHRLCDNAYETAVKQDKRLGEQVQDRQQQIETAWQQCQALEATLCSDIEAARTLATAGGAEHVLAWLEHGTLNPDEAIEKLEPWQLEGWRQARARVFIEALHLHKTLFQIEAKRLSANLYCITRQLTGAPYHGISPDLGRSIWASLFMVVPVLSSTFASFARSFGSFGCGEIGWLLVDEAGQATPQAAVGALWRAQRAVLVGDPLQLPPIVPACDAVLEHMRKHYQVDPHWICNRQSAQSLADLATRWGKMLGPSQAQTWVGLPLVVHRRCDRPMFEMANRIAYAGAMVYGTHAPAPEEASKASLPTGWLHVIGPSSGNNWVRQEGIMLRRLLERLTVDGVAHHEITVITPFQDVRSKLSSFLPKQIVYGTIHTMQGKEAQIIILILGGSTDNEGARDWAVSTPNLLNVAVTRAKQRLYVIGDYDDWSQRQQFEDIMPLLPKLPFAMPSNTLSA
ncbi:MAG: DNA helicase [Paucimonas sp.]|nr:DNA helicase [Paucimonas sp.]